MKLLLPIFLALYLLCCFTPLRLEHDSVRYFNLKDCLEYGCNSSSNLPYGYPALLVALSKTGLLSSFTIAFINALYLLCSIVLTRKMMEVKDPLVFYSVVLLNWTCIKLFAYPLSEMQYLFFSTASLYCYWHYSKSRQWNYLVFSFLLAGLAVMTRAIGFALIAALVIGFVWEHRKQFAGKIIWVIGAVLLSGLAFWKLPGVSKYAESLFSRSPNDPDTGNQISTHIKECGQLLLNMPIGKIKNYLPASPVNIIFLLAGIFIIAWAIYALSPKKVPVVIIIYAAIYSLVVFKWPHFDPRFWMPLIPLIAAAILKGPMPSKWISLFVFSLYILIGLTAFGFSLYTQFNKEAFARNQSNGRYRKEYEIHFFGKTINDTSGQTDTAVLQLLKKYD